MKSLACLALLSMFALVGCQSESITESTVENESAIETTPVAFNVSGAPTAEFEVPDMFCEFGCAAKVKEVLAAQTGVEDVKVDFETKRAIIAVDKAKFDPNAAVAALVDYDFGNTKLISSE